MEGIERPVDATHIGPYKATRLWNDLIAAFRQYMPCGRHRRYMKTFDNCFSGTSAAEWLHQYIKTNGNFNSDATRENAISLLNKLYRAGIFEEVNVSKSMRHKQDVQDNRLYRFAPLTPSKMKITRLPLAPRNDAGINRVPLKEKSFFVSKTDGNEQVKGKPKEERDVSEKKTQSKLVRKISILKKDKAPKDEEGTDENAITHPPCHLVTRILSTKEIKDTWKAIFILRIKKVLGISNIAEIISPDLIDGYSVMHNCIYLNKSGIVTNIDAKEQLPHWVVSAMKCLARWPEPPEPGLPNYPGFEKDVFTVVKDYFLTLDEPLVPFHLYEVVTNIFSQEFCQRPFLPKTSICDQEQQNLEPAEIQRAVMAGNNHGGHSPPQDCDDERTTSLWTSASLENIILNLTRKYCMLDSTGSRYGTHEDLQSSSALGQGFDTQEDSRFAGHVNSDFLTYNRSAFPSTDGMDRMGHSRTNLNPFFGGLSYGLASQESCPSLPALSNVNHQDFVSRPNHSAGETYVRSDSWLGGISRKFGSTPNLKVSKYETAFGPDNRTVTRVYYQNGMMTDYGHDDEDVDETVPPIVRKEKVKSASNINNNGLRKAHAESHHPSPSLSRSKSSVDVMLSTHRTTGRAERVDVPVLGVPNSSICRDAMKVPDCQGHEENLKRSHNYDTSCRSTDAVNINKDTFCTASNGCELKSSSTLSINGLCNKADAESVHQTSFHSVSSHSSYHKAPQQQNVILTPGPVLLRKSTPNGHAPALHRRDSLNGNKYNSQPREAKICITSPLLYYASGEKSFSSLPRKSTTGSYVTDARTDNKPLIAGMAKSISALSLGDAHHSSTDQGDKTPTRYGSPHAVPGYGPGYRPVSDNFGPGYRPVLDASKDKSSISSTNLDSLSYAPIKARPVSSLTTDRHVTSTPFSAPQATAPIRGLNSTIGVSLSNITPFYSTSHRNGDNARTSVFMNYPQTRLSEERARNSLQMVLLLLPPASRRKLHLLFKMMMKMTNNPNLCLDPTQTTRSLVLGTFYPAIIRPKEDGDLDELVVLQLVSFLLDFYGDILTPPADIKTQVSERLKILQRPQVIYSPKPERIVRFCEQTNLTDFENQRHSSSQAALESLLENIISDQSMNVKQKLKRLKQFEKTYPSIYVKRFPDAESLATVLAGKPKTKQPLMTKPLNKLRGLRL